MDSLPSVPHPVASAPVALAARSTGDVSSLFGDGYAVRIATPEFNIQY